MADSDRPRRLHQPRRDPAPRPHPGVQKALHNFGVKDLREILDKKHQEPGEKKIDLIEKLPPPDPSYNYLRDPSREKPKASWLPKREERPAAKDLQQHPEKPRLSRNNSNFSPTEALDSPTKKKGLHSSDVSNYVEIEPNVSGEEGASFRGQNPRRFRGHKPSKEDKSAKKELRFSDTPSVIQIEPPKSLRGRNSRGGSRGDRQEKIVSPANIKIQLSTETGHRSCVLDESTTIADLKHIPDQIDSSRSARSNFRRGQGNFRGRGRGRHSFRGRGARPNRRSRSSDNKTEHIDSSNEIQTQVEHCDNDDYEQGSNENDEFADSNEDFTSSYHDDFVKEAEPEVATDSFKDSIAEAIIVTSSCHQDGEVDRSVQVKEANDSVEVYDKEVSGGNN